MGIILLNVDATSSMLHILRYPPVFEYGCTPLVSQLAT